MRLIPFHKYHGTGNDFILLDNRSMNIVLEKEQIAMLCHRRFGIGADGLMLLETTPCGSVQNEAEADFRMVYYNADGGESTMCGNGGRCIVAFAKSLGLISNQARFIAVDGLHDATLEPDGRVRLKMVNVRNIEHGDGWAVLNTGSPHFIQWVDRADEADVTGIGRSIRYESRFAPDGINVNFVEQISENVLFVRTYERGVEDETLSCGTGVTAAAIAASGEGTGSFCYDIQTPGGQLQVQFVKDATDTAQDVWLKGPAVFVFSGETSI